MTHESIEELEAEYKAAVAECNAEIQDHIYNLKQSYREIAELNRTKLDLKKTIEEARLINADMP